MANPRMTLLDLLSKAEHGADPDFLRDGLKLLAQELMDAEVTQLVGAGLHERAETRLTYRNGYREREWDTGVGTIELDIPKLRAATYFPSLLEPRRRHERALLSVVQEAYIYGVSTRPVDALAEALGLKADCPECGYTIRLTKKWADLGLPSCPTDGAPLTLDGGREDGEGAGLHAHAL